MTDPTTEPMLEVTDVVHKYGTVTALSNVSLSAQKGEFLTILGSSGSGKTTMLRVISGLETPYSVKRLRIGGEDVTDVPAAKRRCTTVFQNYALFPHMSVLENVAYGLRIRKVNATDAAAQARRALAMVQLEAKADRSIRQLSGGERQRVALARAVVTRPLVLLLDEPLGALDERLRQDMQLELMELQRKLDMTFVYITHSQEEALTMSDRVVLMRHGKIEQSGRPLDLFDRPQTRFAADFMGYENILPGRLIERDATLGLVELAGGTRVRGTLTNAALQTGDAVNLALRAERIGAVAAGAEGLDGTLSSKVYRGKYTDMLVETPAGQLRLRSWHGAPGETETLHRLGWKVEDAVIFAADGT
ncbi:ABC transporter ATP-binding protein [Pseudodonghicola flavimaris]|uniref:ABC transporter ATP-binding protein n=1 Tax=Pseudodonghicola flavimaris TaxID=3050036 RepID=A0ABT7F5G9_9RHOB|nr:ABC transporter ATP-binding protein [Pseudodonghicola flavimaris]MDK3019870.1 ABC transporter ATP-binding protein [Pseudodonghicola flavimaris]